jgi:hypothetical protein
LTVAEAFESPELVSELAAYSAQLQESACHELEALSDKQNLLFLRVRAAADFYSTNKTLMRQPPAAGVDLILDPYLANIIPRSLLPTIAVIVVAATCAWALSGMVWQKLRLAADVGGSKHHVD